MPPLSRSAIAGLVVLFTAVVTLQAVRDTRLTSPAAAPAAGGNLLYVRSGEAMKRMALSYDALAADLYWMRAVQHYGQTKLSTDPGKQYDLLYPLLDLTVSLDPDFNLAYRFGSIFLAESYPGGAGRPDQAIALLEKGLRSHPDRWQFAQDIGFVHYWWRRDYKSAAIWFTRGGEMKGAPNWLAPLAAVTLAEGGNRQSSRQLWQEVAGSAEEGWLLEQARFRLTQLDAMDQIDALERLTGAYEQQTGDPPVSWDVLVRAGALRGVPLDPRGHPYVLNPYWGLVTLSPASPLNPLPRVESPGA